MMGTILQRIGIPGVHAVGAAATLALIATPVAIAWQRQEASASASLDAAGRLAAERAEWDTLRTKRDALADRERALAERVRLAPRLPAESAITAMLAGLTRTAEEHGLEVRVADVGEPKPEGRLLAVPVRLETNGGYVGVASFMRALWAHFPGVSVEEFSLRASPDPNAGGTAWFVLKAYADREASASGNP